MQTLDKWSLQALNNVWLSCKGVVLLFDYCTSEMLPSGCWSDDELDDANDSFNLQLGIPNISAEAASFFRHYQDPACFKLISLSALDKNSSNAIVTETATNEMSAADLEKIYEASAGKPLYITELVKSFATAGTAEEKERCITQVEGQALTSTMTTTALSYRIEEVICYRLDKLHISSQVVLKAAAVAVAYGRSFDLELLQFMLLGTAYFHNDSAPVSARGMQNAKANKVIDYGKDIEQNVEVSSSRTVEDTLLDLLRAEEFLVVKSKTIKKSEIASIAQLEQCTFDFHIPLEQNTIYGLLVDEQKEFFHERVALFLHRALRFQELDQIDLRTLWEKGYHWDHAALWSRALRSYLLAAKKCKAEGNELRCAESLLMAYEMFQHLEHEVDMLSLPEPCFEYAEQMARCLFDPSEANMQSVEQCEELVVALKSAQEMFEHEPGAMVDSVELHIMLAESYLYKWEDFQEVLRKLLVALLIDLAAIWKPSSKKKEISTRSKRKSMKLVDNHGYIVLRRAFTRSDRLHLLSLCFYTSRLVLLEMPLDFPFEDFMFLFEEEVDDDRGVVQTSDKDGSQLLHIQAEVMIALRYLQLGKAKKAAFMLDQTLQKYDSIKDSQALTQRYTIDLLPYTLGLLSQALLADQLDLEAGSFYWQKAMSCLQGISHGYSCTIALIPVMSCVHFTAGYIPMISLLHQMTEQQLRFGYDSMGSQFSKLLIVWLQLASTSLEHRHEHLDSFLSIAKALDASVPSTVSMKRINSFSSNGSALMFVPSSVGIYARDEMTLSKLNFLELHGCALQRIYLEIIGQLWQSVTDEHHIWQMEQRIQHCLQILLQSPAYDYMSMLAKSYNMLHSLLHILKTVESVHGMSAGVLYIAVTERAEQPLLQLVRMLQGNECIAVAWMLAEICQQLPLHEGIIESYKVLLRVSVEQLGLVCFEEQARERLQHEAKKIGLVKLVPKASTAMA
jgi:hypothetical protein